MSETACKACDDTGLIDADPEDPIFCFCPKGLRMWAESYVKTPIRDTGEGPKPEPGQLTLFGEGAL